MTHDVTVHWSQRDPAFVHRILARAELKKRGGTRHEWDVLNAIPLVAERVFDAASARTHCPRGFVDEHMVKPTTFNGRPAVERFCWGCGSSWIELLP